MRTTPANAPLPGAARSPSGPQDRGREACILVLLLAASVAGCAAGPVRVPAQVPPSMQMTRAEPALLAVPDCALDEIAYYRCPLGKHGAGVAVCGKIGDDGRAAGLQVRLHAPDGTIATVPAQVGEAQGVLQLHVLTQPQLSCQALTFAQAGKLWVVFSEYDAAEGDGSPRRGVRVRDASHEDGWLCEGDPIDRMGELETLLVADMSTYPR